MVRLAENKHKIFQREGTWTNLGLTFLSAEEGFLLWRLYGKERNDREREEKKAGRKEGREGRKGRRESQPPTPFLVEGGNEVLIILSGTENVGLSVSPPGQAPCP